MRILFLGARLRAQMVAQARKAFPRECCGLIDGVRRDNFIKVSALRATRNVATEADSFEIDPAEQIGLLREARAAGREVIGCYHSHPSGRPDLSSRDREHADEDGFVWLIASLATADAPVLLRAFVVENGKFEPLKIS